MTNRVSFWMLVATVIAVGLLFFQVMQPFFFPLMSAGILALLFRPVYVWLIPRCRGRYRLAAALTTLFVVLVGLLPLAAASWFAGRELVGVVEQATKIDFREHPQVARVMEFVEKHVTPEQLEQLRSSAVSALQRASTTIYSRTQALIGNLVGFVIGFLIMCLALYYFFADGPHLLTVLQRMSPLDDDDERVLFQEFDRVARGVVMATLLCAIVQAVLALIAFAIVGLDRLWLWAALTLVVSMIPFVGAAGVWVPVTVWLILQGHYGSAVFMGIFGAVVISGSDNIIRAFALKGSTNLHPLIALISVLGALQVVGIWGVFIGPITAAFFYALLKILNTRIAEGDRQPALPPAGLNAP
jgi:predicted PurR-regulated permease PerM